MWKLIYASNVRLATDGAGGWCVCRSSFLPNYFFKYSRLSQKCLNVPLNSFPNWLLHDQYSSEGWLEVGLPILLTYLTKNLFCDYTLPLHHTGRVGLVGSGIATQCLSLVRSVSPVFSASRSELSTFQWHWSWWSRNISNGDHFGFSWGWRCHMYIWIFR